MKAIILLPGTNRFSPGRLGSFLWSYAHNAHVWQGRELDLEEFNRVVDEVLASEPQRTRRPTVRLIAEQKPEPAQAPQAPSLSRRSKRQTPVPLSS